MTVAGFARVASVSMMYTPALIRRPSPKRRIAFAGAIEGPISGFYREARGQNLAWRHIKKHSSGRASKGLSEGCFLRETMEHIGTGEIHAQVREGAFQQALHLTMPLSSHNRDLTIGITSNIRHYILVRS